MSISAGAERELIILDAAMTAFARYGFRRTKMDDIARASGIARTALYKIYRNKEHIFTALVEQVHIAAEQEAEQVLASEAPFRERLCDAMVARDRHLLTIGHSGPHADEIAELYLSLAWELSQRFNNRLSALIAQSVDQAILDRQFTLPAAFVSSGDFARLARLALEGIKKEIKAEDEFERLARQLLAAMMP